MADSEVHLWIGNLHVYELFDIIRCHIAGTLDIDPLDIGRFIDIHLRSSCANQQHNHNVASVGIVRDNCMPCKKTLGTGTKVIQGPSGMGV